MNLLAFSAIPNGLHQTQLMIFPADSQTLKDQSERVGFAVTVPARADVPVPAY